MLLPLLAGAQPAVWYDPGTTRVIALGEQSTWAKAARNSTVLAPSQDYDIHYHCLRWQIDPRVHFIKGSVTTAFQTLQNLDTLYFDMSDSLQVDSAVYHQSRLLSVHHQDNILAIGLPTLLGMHTNDSVTLYYHGAPIASGLGSFVTSGHGHHTASNDSVLWTLSEPYGSRDWWPGKMTLDDKIDSLDIYVTVPNGYSVATNGMPADTLTGPSETRYHWKHRYPIANYLICLASTNYAFQRDTVQLGNTLMPIFDFWYPEYLPQWNQQKPDDHAMLRMYSNLFGPYPFIREKYGHAQMNRGGGMEHQTMTFESDGGFELVAHEMAHHWFGDKLTCRSWQDIWLNEGFATYCSALCYEYLSPPQFQYYKIFLRQKKDYILSQPDGSVFVDDTTNVWRIFDARLSYSKGAYVLHMLRWKLGDSAFFAGLRNYLSDPVMAYSFCRTEELEQHLEAASGQSLHDFFQAWIYGQGYPIYSMDWAEDHQNRVTLEIHQTTSHPSVPFYAMPVPVTFKSKTDSQVVIFNQVSPDQTFSATLPFMADSALLDPDYHILHGNSKVRRLPSLDASEFLLLLPNPAPEEVTCWYDATQLQISRIQLFRIDGRLLQDLLVPAGQDGKIILSLQSVPAGVYVLQISTQKGMVFRKLVKS